MLHTVLGITCFDPDFRRALFDNPATAVRTHNSYTNRYDIRLLQAITENRSLELDFKAVETRICTHPPCPPVALGVLEVIGAALLDKTFCEELFADAIQAANKNGFSLRYPETYVLTSLINGKNKTDLKQVLDTLGHKIIELIEKKAVAPAA